MLLNSKIGVKLFLFISLIILVSILPFSYVSVKTLKNFGGIASSINEAEIRAQSYAYLSGQTRELSKKYEAAFSKISNASSLLASQAEVIYNNIDLFSSTPFDNQQFSILKNSGIFSNPPSSSIATLYWGNQILSENITTEIKALSWLDPLFNKIKDEIPESLAVHNITVSGIGRYLTTDEAAKKTVFDLPSPAVFDLRDGEPVTIHLNETAGKSTTKWTKVYKDDVVAGLMMTSSSPIYDNSGGFRGIAGIDVPLEYFIDELLSNKNNSSGSSENILLAFLIDEEGRLIAFPKELYHLFGLEADYSHFKDSGDVINHKLAESSLPDVIKIANEIVKEKTTLHEIFLNGQKHIISSEKLPSLGWHLGLVMSEADMLSSITQTHQELGKTLYQMVDKFQFYAMCLVGVSLICLLLGIRSFILPLKNLTDVVLNVSKGNLEIKSSIKRNDEIGILSCSFNSMIDRLRHSAELEKKHTVELEEKIRERTVDVERKNNELETTLKNLQEEISQRIKTEETLKKYKRIVSSTPDLISLIDKKYTYRIVNDAYLDIHGRERHDIVGHTIEELFGPVVFEQEIKKRFDLCLEGNVSKYQSWFDYKKAGRRYMAVNYSPYFSDGEIEGVLVSVRDITDIKAAEQKIKDAHDDLEIKVAERTKELAEANLALKEEIQVRANIEKERRALEVKAISQSKLASLGEIATGIAHEINQPLSYIQIMYQSILRDLNRNCFDQNELAEDCQEALKQVSRITKIINHLRTFGRDDALMIEDVFLNSVLENTLILLGQQLKLNNIRLSFEVVEDLPPIRGNSAKMEQVFINLFQNSIDALRNKKDAEIKVFMHKHNDMVKIQFIDNGEGIPVAIQAKIFQPFFTTKEVGKGTGLGLSIVYGIIKEFNGEIEYVHHAEGSCFEISLPACNQQTV